MPERLHAALLLSPPGIFDALLAVCRPMLDARTAAKVHILRPAGTGEALRAHLGELLQPHGVHEPATLDWLAEVLQSEHVPGNLPAAFPAGARPLQLDHAAAAAAAAAALK